LAYALQLSRTGDENPGQLARGLCCKNNSIGEPERTANLVGQLFSLQSKDFLDELVRWGLLPERSRYSSKDLSPGNANDTYTAVLMRALLSLAPTVDGLGENYSFYPPFAAPWAAS
jgi:hypothetical protein